MKIDPTMRVIVLTAFSTAEDGLCSMQAGCIEHVAKPFDPPRLITSVRFVANASDAEIEVYRRDKLIELLHEQHIVDAAKLAKLARRTQTADTTTDSGEALKAICGIAAHRMKGELLHIGSAVEDIRAEPLVRVDTETHHELNEKLSAIDRSARYIDSAIRQLLAYVDIGPAALQNVGLPELLDELNYLIQRRVPRNVTFKIAPLTEQIPVLTTDHDQLLAVLLEIVTNALKAVRQTSGEVCLSIKTDKNEFLMAISDNGPGIPPATEKDLFDMPTAGAANGLGVGLLLCGRIMKYLNGTLKVETGPKGTTVTVVLPLEQKTFVKESAERMEAL
jgi:signal transduction histidine kinase